MVQKIKRNPKTHFEKLSRLYSNKDSWWLAVWLIVLAGVWLWDSLFLNAPALRQIETGFVNTFFIAVLVVAFSLLLSWLWLNGLFLLESADNNAGYWLLTFLMNLIRSIPQIIGILLAYVFLTHLITTGVVRSSLAILILMALSISLFVFPELTDLLLERVAYFRRLDFYNAMQVCGISEKRIINFNILWKNSRVHILNKLIAVAGMAIFLQCSVDFIISVGLSRQVSSLDLPVSLGSLLATIDSKQDILALGYSLSHPGYTGHLFFEHLQGLSVAFALVFSLLSLYKIANGFARRRRL